MQVRMLGPFQLDDGGQRIAIGGIRQRAVLANLALRSGELLGRFLDRGLLLGKARHRGAGGAAAPARPVRTAQARPVLPLAGEAQVA